MATTHLLKAVKYTGPDTLEGRRIWVLLNTTDGDLVGGECPDYARTSQEMYELCEQMFPANSTWQGRRVHGGYRITVD